MIPEGWEKVKLGNHVDIFSGKSPSQFQFSEIGSYPFFKVNQLNFCNKYLVDADLYYETKSTYLKKGAVIFPKRGASIFTNKIRILHIDGYIDTNLMCLYGDDSLYNDFLYYWLVDFGLFNIADTSSIPQINNKHIEPLILPLPPLPEQKKITSILSSVDEAIQANQKVIDQTEKVKKGLLQELLTKGIGHTEFKKTEIGEIPVEWEIKPLGEVCDFINGRGFKPHEWKDEGLPIIRIQNLNGSDIFNYYSGEYAKKILINPNNLLFAWSGSRGTSFGPHIWKGPIGLLNYHTWKIEITSKVNKDYLHKALQKITKEIEDNAHGASALVHMQKAYIVDYKIPFPPLAEQKEISNKIDSVNKSIIYTTARLDRLQNIKKGLMQDLLTGKVRVKV